MSVLFGLWNEGKGWGSKGHELFPVIFTMAGRKGKFAWGFKTVDARNGGLEGKRERESRARVNAQRGRGECGGMIWRLSNGITGKRFSHGSLSNTTVRPKMLCLKLLHALLAQDHDTEGDLNVLIFMCWLILLTSVSTYCAHTSSYIRYCSRLHLCLSCNIPSFVRTQFYPISSVPPTYVRHLFRIQIFTVLFDR